MPDVGLDHGTGWAAAAAMFEEAIAAEETEAAIAAERKSQLVVLWGTHFLLILCWSWVGMVLSAVCVFRCSLNG